MNFEILKLLFSKYTKLLIKLYFTKINFKIKKTTFKYFIKKNFIFTIKKVLIKKAF